jgi:hypothetical protein
VKKCPATVIAVFLLSFILTASVSFAAVQVLDNFNRADGPIGGNWTVQAGSFNVVSNAAQGGPTALATFNGVTSKVVEADIRATGSAVSYVGLVLGYADPSNNYFVKAQNSGGGNAIFDTLFCYYGNNGSAWGSPYSFGLSPSFTTAHMRVEYNSGTGDVTTTFSNIDGGSGTQQYVCPGAPASGGSGVGMASYDITLSSIDNFAADLPQQQLPTTSVPAMTEWGIMIFMVVAGLVAIYYLRRQRRAES